MIETFKKLAAAQATFISRGDESGTHQKEKALWKGAGGDLLRAVAPRFGRVRRLVRRVGRLLGFWGGARAALCDNYWSPAHRRLLARRSVGWIGVASGVVGLMLAGATAGLIGTGAGAVGLLYAIARRRRLEGRDLAVTGAVVALVAGGVLILRAGDFEHFLRFVHLKGRETQSANIQTYSQHALIAYIGYLIWRDHPAAGAGWQASNQPGTVDPELPAAHRKFPDVSQRAFPTHEHEWGVAETVSGLVGAIWQVSDKLAFDIALRDARVNGHTVNELRAGVTFGLLLW